MPASVIMDAVHAAGLGLFDDEVRVVDHDPAWAAAFVAIAGAIAPAVPCARVAHIGSTAVPGLPAKPLIDVSVGLCRDASLDVESATSVGLVFRAVNPESVVFAVYGDADRRVANVHVRSAGSAAERWDLVVRDFLRSHPDAARRYAEVKVRAAMEVEGRGRAEYSLRKGRFFAAVAGDIETWANATEWRLPDPPTGEIRPRR